MMMCQEETPSIQKIRNSFEKLNAELEEFKTQLPENKMLTEYHHGQIVSSLEEIDQACYVIAANIDHIEGCLENDPRA
jgi:hypothetical protein